MNWYIYWFIASSYFVKHLFGFLTKRAQGVSLYFAILLTPAFALYSILFIGIDRLLGTRIYNEYYWVLGLVVAASHIVLFCLNTKLSYRWEDTYRKCCTDRKNMISGADSVVAVVVWIVLLAKWVHK